MATLDTIIYRPARSGDAADIAALHADSWRRNYRGAYSDVFLDGDVDADRLAVWTHRLEHSGASAITVVADDDGVLVGFIHLVLDADLRWGSLVDNLHVLHERKRSGIGHRLMAEATNPLRIIRPKSGFYLWVLEQNVAAQAFYRSVGGKEVERTLSPAPAGDPRNLAGAPARFRYAWPASGIVTR